MKKLLAILLAVAMLCTLSVSVFAATTTAKPVGTHGANAGGANSVNDGVAPDGSGNISGSTPLQLGITATISEVQHRYAVDIDYEPMNFEISSANLVWDVNRLEYVPAGASGAPTKSTYSFKVINYSDLDVKMTAVLTDTMAEDCATLALVGITSGTPVVLKNAVGLTPGNVAADANDDKNVKLFTVTISPADGDPAKTWTDVANYYANYFSTTGTSSKDMGSLTLTFTNVTP